MELKDCVLLVVGVITLIFTVLKYRLDQINLKIKEKDTEKYELECRIKIHETLLKRIKKGEIENLGEFTNSSDFQNTANSNIQTKASLFVRDFFDLTDQEVKALSRPGQLQERVKWKNRQLNDLEKDLMKEINKDRERLKQLKISK